MSSKFKQAPPPLEMGKESIGQRIAKLRKSKGLTQQELARNIGIRRTLVTDYEIGRLHLNDEMIVRFAQALEVSADEILGLDSLPASNEPDLKITRRLKQIESLPPTAYSGPNRTLIPEQSGQ